MELDMAMIAAELCLEAPWHVSSAEVNIVTQRLYVGLTYPDGTRFDCPNCGAADCPIDLSWPRIWGRKEFLGHPTYLLARLPDLACDRCGIVPVRVSWVHPDMGFALLRLSPARPGLPEWCGSGPVLIRNDLGEWAYSTELPFGPVRRADVGLDEPECDPLNQV